MTVCNDCGDTLVVVWVDSKDDTAYELCPDCFFAALTIRHRGTGRESGGAVGQPQAVPNAGGGSGTGVTTAKFLCPSCHAYKPWPFKTEPLIREPRRLDEYARRNGIVCSSCYTYAQEAAERAQAREDEMRGYVDGR